MVSIVSVVVVAWFAFSVPFANLRWFPTPWRIKTRRLPKTLSPRLPCHPTPSGEIVPNIFSLVIPLYVPPSVSHVQNQIAIRVKHRRYPMNFIVKLLYCTLAKLIVQIVSRTSAEKTTICLLCHLLVSFQKMISPPLSPFVANLPKNEFWERLSIYYRFPPPLLSFTVMWSSRTASIHLREQHGPKAKIPKKPCHFCGVLLKESSLKQHIQLVHSESQQLPCPSCKKVLQCIVW